MITAPLISLTTDTPPSCPCGQPATYASRRGPVCSAHAHPAHIRLALAAARDAERVA